MIFKRFYDESLAQASYLIGCERTREGGYDAWVANKLPVEK